MGDLGSQKDGVGREEPDSSGEVEEKRYNPIDQSELRIQEKEKNKEHKRKEKGRNAST